MRSLLNLCELWSLLTEVILTPQECHDAKDTQQKAIEAYQEVTLLHC